MNAALYFPFLRGKQGELDALGYLSPVARSRTCPLIDIPRKKETDKRTLETYITDLVMQIKAEWGTKHPLYIDLNRYAPDLLLGDGRHPVELVFEITNLFRVKAVPVSGPESVRGPGSGYLDAIRSISREYALSPAIRLPLAEFSEPSTIYDELRIILETQGLESRSTDVFLDAESLALLPARSRLIDVLRDVLNRISELDLRSVIFIGSSVPEKVGPEFNDEPLHVRRDELKVWKELVATPDCPSVHFGDYGVVWPFQSDVAKPVIPPSRVRLSTDGEYIFFRGDREDHRELCQEVCEDPAFYSQAASWGKNATLRCGLGGSGAGAPADWVARDTNMHIESTVAIVERLLKSADNQSSKKSVKPRREPWLQEMLGLADID